MTIEPRAFFCKHANAGVPTGAIPLTPGEKCPCLASCWCKEHSCAGTVDMKRHFRIALCGASGTGKTTLATYASELLKIPLNPVGSRSVSKAMGFDSPYDVDKAGRRAEFQRRLLTEKRDWEADQLDFVTDRTTFDNLTYTVFHDVSAVDAQLFEDAKSGLARYTHVIYFPVAAFCAPGGDPNRVQDMTYHQMYDTMIEALVQRHMLRSGQEYARLTVIGQDNRRDWLKMFLQL